MKHRPLVSCIMPTHNRRPLVPRAVAYFLRQDYPKRELILVDDGTDPVKDLMPDDPRVRYLRREGRLTVGAKRNLACEAATGEIIAHWDDDDWMAPWRLSYQVESLLNAQADACGVARLFFYAPHSNQAWLYIYPSAGRPWVAGGTLCYTKALWRRNPFPAINQGEDTRFVWSGGSKKVLALPDNSFYVALIHADNTSPKRTRGSRWHDFAVGHIQSLMGTDWAFYTQLQTEKGSRQASQTQPKIHAVPQEMPMPAHNNCPVTVSIPYFRCKPYLRTAVESILGQTHTALSVVIVNDGDDAPWDELAHIQDPRLIRFDLSANRGRYFADAVVLQATADPYFAVQDADDWSEPHRISVLLQKIRQDHADGVISASYHHHLTNDEIVARRNDCFPARGKPLTDEFEHRANHHGLFRATSLRNLGYYGGFRVGYDTLIMNLLLMTGRVSYVDEALYHRRLRAESLTGSGATGFGSQARQEATRQMQKMYRQAYGLYSQYLAGSINAKTLNQRIGHIVADSVTPQQRTELQEEAQRLRALLKAAKERHRATAQSTCTGKAKIDESSRRVGVEITALLDDPRLTWGGWAISKPLAVELARRLEATRPRRILELGSGTSTVVLADYATRHDAQVVSLEHERQFCEKTRDMLIQLGLAGVVDVKLAPIKSIHWQHKVRYPWYGAELSGKFDFIFVDGPPLKVGRQATLFGLADHLEPNWELWLKDGYREHERACIAIWKEHFRFSGALYGLDHKGVWILSSKSDQSEGQEMWQHPTRTGCPTVAGAGDDLPLVSCIMPTHNRHRFLPQAVKYFLRQDYPNRELIIVDDGTDPVEDLIPKGPHIQPIRLPRKQSIGAKRNLACEAANGEIILCWDDDDWYAQDRISYQVTPLLEEKADLTGLDSILLLDLATGQFWSCTPELHRRMFYQGIVSGTLAFWKKFWQQGARFPHKSIAEDAAFHKMLIQRGARMKRLSNNGAFVYIRHGANSWRFTPGRYLDRTGWFRVEPPLFMPAQDLEFYGVRNAR